MIKEEVQAIIEKADLKNLENNIRVRCYPNQGKLDGYNPKTADVTVGEGGLMIEGQSYVLYLLYANMVRIILQKGDHLYIQMDGGGRID